MNDGWLMLIILAFALCATYILYAHHGEALSDAQNHCGYQIIESVDGKFYCVETRGLK